MKFERFGVVLHKRLGIVDNEGEVAATASTGHLPGEDVGHGAVVGNGLGDVAIILIGVTDVGRLDHAGEHGGLGIEGGSVGSGKAYEVFLQDGLPAVLSGIGKSLDLSGGDILVLDNTAAGLAGLDGNHHEVLLEEAEGHLIGGVLDLLGPEIVIIVVTAQARNADADGILGTRDMAVLTLGVVLEAEDQTCQHLGIHLGELDGPDLLDHLAGRGAEAATVSHLKGGLQRDGEGPTGMVLADVGLVDPGTCEIKAGGNA